MQFYEGEISMVVYRICKKEEIEHIFNDKNFKNVGKIFEINKNTNTHLYTADKKYIHFFIPRREKRVLGIFP